MEFTSVNKMNPLSVVVCTGGISSVEDREMKATTFKITASGEVFCLYDEDSPIVTEGHVSVIRASNVLFDEQKQEWFVEVNMIDGSTKQLSETFKKRSEAIAHEISFLNGVLSRGIPVESFFKN